MFLSLSTTRTDGGWMYFKMNNDDYIRLSGSDNKANIYKDTSISGNLKVGPTQATTPFKAHVNHAGNQRTSQIEARRRSQGFIHFNTDYADGLLLTAVKDDLYMYCGLNAVHFYKPTTNASDDRF